MDKGEALNPSVRIRRGEIEKHQEEGLCRWRWMGGMWPQAQDTKGAISPRSWKRQEVPSPGASGGDVALPHPKCSPPASRLQQVSQQLTVIAVVVHQDDLLEELGGCVVDHAVDRAQDD